MNKKPSSQERSPRNNELCLLLVSTAIAAIVIIGLVIYGG